MASKKIYDLSTTNIVRGTDQKHDVEFFPLSLKNLTRIIFFKRNSPHVYLTQQQRGFKCPTVRMGQVSILSGIMSPNSRRIITGVRPR
jgi:hypothetical protein